MKALSNRRRGGLLWLSALVFLCSPVFGFDFGLSIGNKTDLIPPYSSKDNSPDAILKQTNTADLWATLYFGNEANLGLKANYTFSYNSKTGAVENTFDLTSLQFFLASQGPVGSNLKNILKIGRTNFRDFSGEVINHKLDGVLTQISVPGLNWEVGVGTTALLFKNSSTIFLNRSDLLDQTKPDVILANPRLIALMNFSLPRLIFGSDLTIGLVGEADLDSGYAKVGDAVIDPSTTMGGALHALYGGVKLDGKITGPLFYEIFGYLQTASSLAPSVSANTNGYVAGATYKAVSTIAGLGGAGLTLYLREALSSVLELSALIGTGDAEAGRADPDANILDSYNGFFGLSQRGTSLIYIPQLTNIFEGKLSYSFRPFSQSRDPLLQGFQFQVTGRTWLRPVSTGPVSISGIKSGYTGPYLGSELDAKIGWRISSDTSLNLSYGLFIPNQEAYNRKAEMLARLELDLSL